VKPWSPELGVKREAAFAFTNVTGTKNLADSSGMCGAGMNGPERLSAKIRNQQVVV
jgi:hypothetical protein